MYPKLLMLTIGLLAMAAGLLALRHERAQLTYELVRLHRDNEMAQRELWRAEATAAIKTRPADLMQRIGAAGLTLEPASPPKAAPVRAQLVADDDRGPTTP